MSRITPATKNRPADAAVHGAVCDSSSVAQLFLTLASSSLMTFSISSSWLGS